jgi:hypothetical protein
MHTSAGLWLASPSIPAAHRSTRVRLMTAVLKPRLRRQPGGAAGQAQPSETTRLAGGPAMECRAGSSGRAGLPTIRPSRQLDGCGLPDPEPVLAMGT